MVHLNFKHRAYIDACCNMVAFRMSGNVKKSEECFQMVVAIRQAYEEDTHHEVMDIIYDKEPLR